MYYQDYYTEEDVRKIFHYFLKCDFLLVRNHSVSHQVYSALIDGRNRFVIKIAGKHAHKPQLIRQEITCLRDLRKAGLPVPEILFTNEDMSERKGWPFFIMPCEGNKLRDLFSKNMNLAREACMFYGDFIYRLSRFPVNGQEYIISKEKSIQKHLDLLFTCSNKLAALDLFTSSLKSGFNELENSIINDPLILGQIQAGELLCSGSGYCIIDWSEGLCYTYPMKTIQCICKPLDDTNPDWADMAFRWIAEGYYGTEIDLKSLERVYILWRMFRGIYELTVGALIHENDRILIDNYTRFISKNGS